MNNKIPLRAVIAFVIFALTLLYFYGGGLEDQVAGDAIKQYEIAKRSGNQVDAYVHAGIVAAAYPVRVMPSLQSHVEMQIRYPYYSIGDLLIMSLRPSERWSAADQYPGSKN
jgi:hypothetical protein